MSRPGGSGWDFGISCVVVNDVLPKLALSREAGNGDGMIKFENGSFHRASRLMDTKP